MSTIAEALATDTIDVAATIANVMAVTAEQAAGKPATKARRKPATKPTDTEPTMEQLEAALRTAWDEAGTNETSAKTLLDAAKIAWENTRVIRSRVAFKAAMLKPGVDGAANLLNAARILGTDPEADNAERTKAAKSRKNSLRNYVNAGVALNELGMAYRDGEPDAEERKVVAEAFKAGNKRPDTPADETGGEGESESETGGNIDPAALGVVDIVGHIARMQAAFKLIKDSSVVISEQEAGKVGEMLAEFTAQLEEYAEGK